MATKNIKPRGNGEGNIGTSVRRWLGGFFKNINVDTEAIVPTPAATDNSTKAATTAYVKSNVPASVGDTDTPVYTNSDGKITSIGSTLFAKVVTHLLSTAAATISGLSTSSLFYRFLAQALSVAGVQYNLSNSSAWYICLGSLFGGLIIQGGYMNNGDGFGNTKTFPITFSSPMTNAKPTIVCMGRSAAALTDATIKTPYIDKFEWNAWTNGAAATSVNSIGVYWIAFGY